MNNIINFKSCFDSHPNADGVKAQKHNINDIYTCLYGDDFSFMHVNHLQAPFLVKFIKFCFIRTIDISHLYKFRL